MEENIRMVDLVDGSKRKLFYDKGKYYYDKNLTVPFQMGKISPVYFKIYHKDISIDNRKNINDGSIPHIKIRIKK